MEEGRKADGNLDTEAVPGEGEEGGGEGFSQY
jgi:hypothetical protein